MTRSAASLFRPFTLGPLTLANRIVMAPMTRSKSPGGMPGADVAAYYRRRAEAATGLIVTEGTTIDEPVSSMDVNVPNFFGAALDGWRPVAEAVHAAGGKIMPQLWHVGMARNPQRAAPNPERPAIGPSGLTKPGVQRSEPMTKAQIEHTIRAFAQGAADARRLGFDGIEIHGAHGYLIDQFFWDGTNQRQDEYGGDLVQRTRFAAEIIAACRAATAPDFPISLRFSQWKLQDYEAKLAPDPDALRRFLAPLVAAGVDLFHCSQRRFWEPEFAGSPLNLAGWTRELSGKPAITVGSVGLSDEFIGAFRGQTSDVAGLDDLILRLERQEFDLVAVGRALLADPAWARKIRDGAYDQLQPFEPSALATLS